MLIKNREDLQKQRAVYEQSVKLCKKSIIVCCGTGCLSGGALKIYDKLKSLLEEKKHSVFHRA